MCKYKCRGWHETGEGRKRRVVLTVILAILRERINWIGARPRIQKPALGTGLNAMEGEEEADKLGTRRN